MSVGAFLGIRRSYPSEFGGSADVFIQEINRALAEKGLPAYKDSDDPPNPYQGRFFGRSELDHHSGAALIAVGDGSSRKGCRHLSLLAENPYRVAFLPIDFDEPIQTDYSKRVDGELTRINVGSLHHLAEDLQLSAAELGIKLVEGLPDESAEKINSFEPLSESDCDYAALEDERSAWLLVYEGRRLALLHQVALSFAS